MVIGDAIEVSYSPHTIRTTAPIQIQLSVAPLKLVSESPMNTEEIVNIPVRKAENVEKLAPLAHPAE